MAVPIRFDDLLAARLLHRQRPDLRRELAAGLRALDEPTAGEAATLLGSLALRSTITREVADALHAHVLRWTRWRGGAIYAGLLVARGVAEADVRRLVQGLGDAADRDRIGDAAREQGLIDAESEARLRFQARVALDADLARQVEEYRRRSSEEKAATMVGGGSADAHEQAIAHAAAEAGSDTGLFKLQPRVAEEAEVTSILDRASLDLSRHEELPPPRFPIPGWIDTAHAMTGRTVGKWRILGKVGAGAMATVYLADEGDRSRPYALKLLPPGAGAERAARFKREILANSFFSHDNVIDVFDAGVAPDGQYYLAMEFMDGEDLDDLIRAEGTLSLRAALKVGRQVGRALAAAHAAGIVHRDVKPSNILVSTDGATAKLMDFGLALIRDLGDFKAKVFESEGGGVTGTPEYLSPEQALRDPLGPPSDLYALGLVIYKCLAGRAPWSCKSPTSWIHAHIHTPPLPLAEAVPGAAWPPQLLELLAALLEKDPAKRVQSAEEAVERIDAVFDGLGATRRKLNPFRRT